MSGTKEWILAHKELQDEVRRLKAENQELRRELDLARKQAMTAESSGKPPRTWFTRLELNLPHDQWLELIARDPPAPGSEAAEWLDNWEPSYGNTSPGDDESRRILRLGNYAAWMHAAKNHP
jgi:hypothetical protein